MKFAIRNSLVDAKCSGSDSWSCKELDPFLVIFVLVILFVLALFANFATHKLSGETTWSAFKRNLKEYVKQVRE